MAALSKSNVGCGNLVGAPTVCVCPDARVFSAQRCISGQPSHFPKLGTLARVQLLVPPLPGGCGSALSRIALYPRGNPGRKASISVVLAVVLLASGRVSSSQ